MNDLSGLWEPLKESKHEIRVLLLKPSNVNDAPLEGWLENKSLNQALHFEAISYTWGGAQASISLRLETRHGSVEMPLTEHLGSALRSLRRSTGTISLWIDAICISQRDRGEREKQIGMLHHIFHRATQVHAWLGKPPEGLVDVVTRASIPRIQWPPGSFFHHLMLASHSMYWDRLWVVGEIVLARDLILHYGQRSSSVRVLMQELEQNKSLSESSLPQYLKDLFDLRTVLPSSMGRSPDEKANLLLAVMSRARPRQVGDQRDRVHAFVGLYNSLFNDEIRADYSANVASVYTAFAKRLINATNSLRILSQANSHYASTASLPSWVPDWASMYDHSSQAADLSWWDIFSPALPFRPVSFTDESDGHCSLLLKGCIYQKVSTVADVLDGCTTRATIMAKLAAWAQFLADSNTYHAYLPTQVVSNFTIILAITLLRGVEDDDAHEDRFSILSPPVRSFYEKPASPYFLKHISAEVPTEPTKFSQEVLTAFPGCYKRLLDKRLFLTESGAPGIGPRCMRQGDIVAFLAGATVPFVLRPCAPQSQQLAYHVVGYCYMADMLKFQAGKIDEPLTVERIRLR